MSNDQQFYVSQKAVIAKEGKVLLMFDPEFGADFPGGKIKEGELDFAKELRREVTEETGLEISIGHVFGTGYFEVPLGAKNKNAGRKIFNVYYACRYVSGELRLSAEHIRYQWVGKDDFLKYADRPAVQNILAKYFTLFPDLFKKRREAKEASLL